MALLYISRQDQVIDTEDLLAHKFWVLELKINDSMAGPDLLEASFHGGRQLPRERERMQDSESLTKWP